MKSNRILSVTCPILICWALLLTHWSSAQETPPDPRARSAESADSARGEPSAAYEELARGPLHEALAQPFVANPQRGEVVQKQPPDPIEEIPPEKVPEGRNVQWIPGYWGWDDVNERFVWISGLWRDVPPGRQWVPGYWTRLDEGFSWISGFWSSADQQEVAYLPYPPEPRDLRPTYEAPGDDYFWVPGCWVWHDADYAWRPGYWSPAYAGWAWVPHRYVWTPRGAVFVSGYWDYPLANRGLLFAPVYFHDPVWTYANFYYRPATVVQLGPVLVHLWLRSQYHHYYFGDYYGDRYAHLGYAPWYAAYRGDFGYDPLLTYYRWSAGRRNYDFVERMDSWHRYFVRHEDHRPPHTMRQLREVLGDDRGERKLNLDESVARQLALTEPLENVAGKRENGMRLRELPDRQRTEFREQSQQLREFLQQRAEFENSAKERTAPRGERQPGETPAQPDLRKTLRLPQTHRVLRPDLDRRDEAGERPPQRGDRPERPGRVGRPDDRRQPGERPGARRPPERADDQPLQPPESRQRPQRPRVEPPRERREAPEQPGAQRPPDRPKGQPPKRPDAQQPQRPRGEGRGAGSKEPRPPQTERAPEKGDDSPPKSPREKPKQDKPKQGKDDSRKDNSL